MKNQILVIEDVLEMSELICLYMKNAGFDTKSCETAEDAIKLMSDGFKPDLVLLDLNLPGMSGLEFLRYFRQYHKTTIPVIIVSARDADEDIITALGYGADEFVTKPFSPKVLAARVKSKLDRLSVTEASVEETITFGPYTLYCNSCILKKDNVKIPLSTKEYEVLEYLVKNDGRPLNPESIYNHVWKNSYGDLTAVAVYIQRLRKKIEEDPANPKYINTMFGMGYRFDR
ncbi:response regulator transcription factor [Treponema sp.]|uniref:response regulator transcription factor n=1 Tax=Treponema sp. TaxID=166 RepID=UPI00257ACB9E|nr:response regulator transcription factor [Treponema sp.]MBE6354162.1 response regulator transcription factor [Treponema sp.]